VVWTCLRAAWRVGSVTQTPCDWFTLRIPLGATGGSSGVSSIFRSFRLLRILKLAKSVQSLRVLLATVGESVSNVSYLTLLLFLFIFIFAVFGMQGRGALCSDTLCLLGATVSCMYIPHGWARCVCP
jgi:hypothetical protein